MTSTMQVYIHTHLFRVGACSLKFLGFLDRKRPPLSIKPLPLHFGRVSVRRRVQPQYLIMLRALWVRCVVSDHLDVVRVSRQDNRWLQRETC